MSTVTTEVPTAPARPRRRRRPHSRCTRPSPGTRRPWTPSGGRGGRWAWCPPWAPSTRATARSSSGRPRECDVVAVSIFVNPTQFGDAADLAHYPRTLEADLEVVAAAGGRIVFAPSVAEMYPEGPARGAHACRCRSWPTGGRGRPGPGTSTGWPPWW